MAPHEQPVQDPLRSSYQVPSMRRQARCSRHSMPREISGTEMGPRHYVRMSWCKACPGPKWDRGSTLARLGACEPPTARAIPTRPALNRAGRMAIPFSPCSHASTHPWPKSGQPKQVGCAAARPMAGPSWGPNFTTTCRPYRILANCLCMIETLHKN